MPTALSQYFENFTRPPPRPARQPGDILRHENPAAVRMRKASARNGMGRKLSGRSHQRHLFAADLVSAVPTMSALLPAQHGPVQGQVAGCSGECLQASVAADPNHVDEFTMFGRTLKISSL
jgi:hypothetical protein